MGKGKVDRGLIQRGEKWGYDFEHAGRRYTATIGTKQDAINALHVERARLLDERLAKDYGIRHGRTKAVTVQQFHDAEYRPWIQNNRAAWTALNDRYVMERFCSAFGAKTLDAPDWPKTLEAYKSERYAAGAKRVTVCHELRRLSAFFTLAVERGRLRASPMSKVEIPMPERREYVLLAPEQEACFFEALASNPVTPMAAPLFRVTFMSGLRRAEALGLKVGQVNLDTATIVIPQPKTGRTKTLHLLPEARAILRGLIPETAAPESYVFHHPNGRPISMTAWSEYFRAARARCGLRGLRPHDLRHTIGQRLADAGCQPAIIGQVLGHAAPYRSTAIYTQHVKQTDVRRALEGVFAAK